MNFYWIAHYNDGTRLEQQAEIGGEGKYPDIDRSRLAAFELVFYHYEIDTEFPVNITMNDRLIETNWIRRFQRKIFSILIGKGQVLQFRRSSVMSLFNSEVLSVKYVIKIIDYVRNAMQIEQNYVIHEDGHCEGAPFIPQLDQTHFPYELPCGGFMKSLNPSKIYKPHGDLDGNNNN